MLILYMISYYIMWLCLIWNRQVVSLLNPLGLFYLIVLTSLCLFIQSNCFIQTNLTYYLWKSILPSSNMYYDHIIMCYFLRMLVQTVLNMLWKQTYLAYALILRVRKQCLNNVNHQNFRFKMIYFIQTG